MDLTQMAHNALTQLNSGVVGGLIIIAIILSAIYSIYHGHWGWFYTVCAGSAVAVAATWIGTTIYGVTG